MTDYERVVLHSEQQNWRDTYAEWIANLMLANPNHLVSIINLFGSKDSRKLIQVRPSSKAWIKVYDVEVVLDDEKSTNVSCKSGNSKT